MKILLLSSHLYHSKNKAGFHHLANAFNKLSNNVHFCTCPNSLLNLLKEIKTSRSRLLARLKSLFSCFFYSEHNGVKIGGYFSIVHNFENLKIALTLFKSIFLKGYSSFSKNP